MFYVKKKLADDLTVAVAIRNDNVFCHCPVCGAEVPVDLEDLAGMADGDMDLLDSDVLCENCAEKVQVMLYGKRPEA